ncbi:Hypothetical predicted protein [Marmota monax]|uniref:Disintegrin domain-containing protein n=1 Tax=Marmota monax TaxID=9995 RepID=A0A5E4BZC7_MARMO|nr:hypothetical protein GHT09_000208 [Marmota monax]VTJ74835.1 Hypothetical predicted protein [Marmota monax]
MVLKEADLVTTHELGHNFGAEHDPDGLAECAPNEDQGGKYVMYPIAVSGDHENNKMFSNCSKQSIYKTIESKAQECFKERSNKVCGNSRVDEGEECDPGIMYLNNDTCCNSDCTLKPGVQCSDRNSPCCKNCQFETAQKKCQEAINATCKGVSYCTGNSSECPPPGNAEDDTVCLDLGKCKDGKCIPFCEREQQLEPCACNGEHGLALSAAAGGNMAFAFQIPYGDLACQLLTAGKGSDENQASDQESRKAGQCLHASLHSDSSSPTTCMNCPVVGHLASFLDHVAVFGVG